MIRILISAALLCLWLSGAQAQTRCPEGTPADICKAAQAEAKRIQEVDLDGVMTVRNSPEERFRTVPCFYRVTEAVEVRITRCEAGRTTSTQPAFVGKWYLKDPKVCRSEVGEAEGLVEYTKTKFRGYESECRIQSTKPTRNGYDVLFSCSGEGETWTDRETLKVSGDVLTRTFRRNGKSFRVGHHRCPPA